MSLNKALNAVVAMLEDRPQLFKELLREPSSDVKNIPEIEARLQKAVKKYAATQIRVGLMKALHVAPSVQTLASSHDETVVFFQGVRATEEVFENLAKELEGPEKPPQKEWGPGD